MSKILELELEILSKGIIITKTYHRDEKYLPTDEIKIELRTKNFIEVRMESGLVPNETYNETYYYTFLKQLYTRLMNTNIIKQ